VALAGVRLDSGDLAWLSRAVRQLLDEAGMVETEILASGDLDEYRIADLLAGGAPIDAFGVGTQLGTSGDAPALGAVYKLVEDARGPRMKLAVDKVTLPGRKQVWRCAASDVVGLHGEDVPDGRPLLERVMANGTRLRTLDHPLEAARQRCRAALDWLPTALRTLKREPTGRQWSVEHSAGLRQLAGAVRARLAEADRKAQSSMPGSANTGTRTATTT
jgi:nicotinate phosphoribosyltransferase